MGCAAQVSFNRDIRPILSDKCFPCHGPDAANRKTKLRFDIESGAKQPLANGRYAIVAGHPEQSEIVRRIASADKAVRMPPAYADKDKLSDREIALLRTWISQGARWEAFWSFIPPKRPSLPEVHNKAWPRNPIDFFVLSRLEREGLNPSREADKATLIRRVTLDLTGLPPSPEELQAYLADTSSGAYEKVVDRLLASPRYGEKMAFRWMEAARYGDTNGYQTDGARDMWRWRDWVVDAFNHNMPWDQFTVDQIAGDLLPHATLDQIVATGFNRNHRTTGEGGIIPEEYRVEYVADRVQTTGTVFMGLTIGCARCHDHKYDPIAQKDFYRLFAFFNQIPDEKGFVWNYGPEEPFVKAPLLEQKKHLDELDATLAVARSRWEAQQTLLSRSQRKWVKKVARSGAPDWTVTDGLAFRHESEEAFDGKRTVEADGHPADFDYLDPLTYSAWIKPDSANGGILSHSEDYFEGQGHGLYLLNGKVRFHLIHRWTDLGLRVETMEPVKLHEWSHVLVTYDGRRNASGVRIYVNGEPWKTKILFDQNNEPFHQKNAPIRVGGAGGMRFQGAIADARIYNRALDAEEAASLATRDTITQIARAASATTPFAAKLKLAFLATAAPESIRQSREQLKTAEMERQKFYDSIPTVMVMADGARRDTFLLKRGAYDTPGEKVSAGVPEILPQLRPDWPDNRLGLAKWLVDRSNPLTARVAVNRFWQSYFGTGIVKTVDDFGSQGEWPSNPELLDWLAVEFMESGWNVKAIQKAIVLSATYREDSRITPDLLKRDPDNRLLARGPRYRLGPEVIRDQALFVSGLLAERLGGPSVKPYQPPGLWQELAGGKGYVQDKGEGLYRRSLYTYWKRTAPPPFMVNFDSPNRETCTVYEYHTNSPLQALDLMNDVTFMEASRRLAERMMKSGGNSPDERIAWAFRLVMAHDPGALRQKILGATYNRFLANYSANRAAAEEFVREGDSPVPPEINRQELAAYTNVASIILNMDEAISKE
jgi:hypothetical protein